MTLLLALLLACADTAAPPEAAPVQQPAPEPEPEPAPVANWVDAAPTAWDSQPTASPLRIAQFALPRAMGDHDDGLVVVYYFDGGGGTVEQNFARWAGQITLPGTADSLSAAQISKTARDGYTFHHFDLSGFYASAPSSGDERPVWRLMGTVIEGEGGPWFIKFTAPKATGDQWAQEYTDYIAALTPAPTAP